MTDILCQMCAVEFLEGTREFSKVKKDELVQADNQFVCLEHLKEILKARGNKRVK